MSTSPRICSIRSPRSTCSTPSRRMRCLSIRRESGWAHRARLDHNLALELTFSQVSIPEPTPCHLLLTGLVMLIGLQSLWFIGRRAPSRRTALTEDGDVDDKACCGAGNNICNGDAGAACGGNDRLGKRRRGWRLDHQGIRFLPLERWSIHFRRRTPAAQGQHGRSIAVVGSNIYYSVDDSENTRSFFTTKKAGTSNVACAWPRISDMWAVRETYWYMTVTPELLTAATS